jgi:hypothetical protein
LRRHGLDRGAREIIFADVADIHAAMTAALTQHRECLLGADGIAVDQCDEGALAGERERAGAADARPAAGDDRHPLG